MFVYYLGALFIAIIYRIIDQKRKDQLGKFPGPLPAAWTNVFRLFDALFGMHRVPSLIGLHEKYGDVIRLGPRVLSFAQPQAVKDIYGTDKSYPKSAFYWTAAAVAKGRPNPSLFSSLDETWHDRLRRSVQPAFNLSALVQYEPFVDSTIGLFLREMDLRSFDTTSEKGSVEDLSRWMHYFAFDVVGELTYGKPFGFLATGSDIDGIIRHAHFYLVYNMVIGQMPWLDNLLLKNPVLLWLNRKGYFIAKPNPVVKFALERQTGRTEGRHQAVSDGRVDLLEKFLQAKEKHPDTVADKEVLGMGISMVLAGSETTAITLSAIFYFLLKTPEAYRRLRTELTEAFPSMDSATEVRTPFSAAQKLPYLDACIKEAFRLHPAARFSLERVLPAHGATIAGEHIPGGTIVGCNAWVIHRNASIFGPDVDEYRPERWLASGEDAKSEGKVAEMNRTLFHFGAGKFGCIGKNISLLEIYKTVPTLLRAFEFELKDPAADWQFASGSFVNVSGIDVKVKRRSAIAEH